MIPTKYINSKRKEFVLYDNDNYFAEFKPIKNGFPNNLHGYIKLDVTKAGFRNCSLKSNDFLQMILNLSNNTLSYYKNNTKYLSIGGIKQKAYRSVISYQRIRIRIRLMHYGYVKSKKCIV